MDADPGGSFLPQIALLVVLIAVNAFFAMAEMATVSSNKARIKSLAEDGNKKAQVLYGLMSTPNRFLSVIQVCITLAGFLQSASAATTIAESFSGVLTRTGVPYAMQISVVVITFVLAFFNLVFGELIPKRIALQHPEKIAMSVAKPVHAVSKVMFPFVWLLSKTVAAVLRLFGIREDKIEEIYSEEEIKSILEVGQETGYIDETGTEMIDNVFEFDDKLAYEIMPPRTDVYMKSINDPLTDYLDEMLKSRFSRVPFFDKDNDDIVGVLYIKDFIIQAKKVGWNRVNVKKLLQKPFFVPESKNIADLFEEMKQSRTHMAFLVDEYGGLSGIVTTEDLVEEVMGDIADEYDDSEPVMEKKGKNHWLLDGDFYLDDINEALGTSLESDDFETIGGLLIDRLGEIADDKDDEKRVIVEDGCRLTVESWKDRRVDKVTLELIPEDEPPESAGKENDTSPQ
ncbi:MAG: hemolysin family protein [Clostridiales Family XIII bacterium]|jgi:putative hemolysin|nr:hemolysin family protein [Clostridiales Family XIII bacterium]